MGKNIIDKIWEAHVVSRKPNTPDVFFIDIQLLHEVTSPQAFEVLRSKNLPLAFPDRNFATIDHSIPTDPTRSLYADLQAKTQVEKLRSNCAEFKVPLFDVNSGSQGIVHVIGPELGITQPGRTMVCGDSHTSTHGAFGALAFGIGTTQISHVMATGTLLLEKPKTLKVNFTGTPSCYFTAKDAVLQLINEIGIQGGTGYALEFCGAFIRNLSMEGRMTICNMAIECGAKFGLISPDETTFKYLEGNLYVVDDMEQNIKNWSEWASDLDASYDAIVEINLQDKKPFVTWGTNPEQSISIDQTIPAPIDFTDPAKQLAAQKALAYTGLIPHTSLIETPIDFVFIGSCTNSRIEDFRAAANIVQGKIKDPNITAFFVPGSEKVRQMCIEEGLDKIFEDFGADFRMSGCSMCLAMNGDHVPAGKRCASTSNRNFVGRQGEGSFTHLMSVEMAALCAVTGKITDPETYFA